MSTQSCVYWRLNKTLNYIMDTTVKVDKAWALEILCYYCPY